jgi:peptidylprolyl isomerase
MQQVKNGDTIKVHYSGKLKDGTTFDSSEGREPFEFEVGAGHVIRGFDNGVLGMEVGQKKTVDIPVEQAYGPEDPQMLMEFPLDRLPKELNPEAGMELMMRDQEGNSIPAIVAEVKENSILLDANHPLAGEDLIFELELLEIVKSKSLIIMP